MDLDKTSLESEYWSDFHLFLNLVQFLETSLSHESTIEGFYGWNGASDLLSKVCYKKKEKRNALLSHTGHSRLHLMYSVHTHTVSPKRAPSSTMNYIYYTWKLMNVSFNKIGVSCLGYLSNKLPLLVSKLNASDPFTSSQSLTCDHRLFVTTFYNPVATQKWALVRNRNVRTGNLPCGRICSAATNKVIRIWRRYCHRRFASKTDPSRPDRNRPSERTCTSFLLSMRRYFQQITINKCVKCPMRKKVQT